MGQQFFHRSNQPLTIGYVLRGRGLPKNPQQLEDAFEAARPPAMVSRRRAVFMHDAPEGGLHGVDGQYVYRVEPGSPVLRLDNRWFGYLQQALLKQKYPCREVIKNYPDWTADFVSKCVNAYWAGMASAEPNWEYLTSGATVLEEVKP